MRNLLKKTPRKKNGAILGNAIQKKRSKGDQGEKKGPGNWVVHKSCRLGGEQDSLDGSPLPAGEVLVKRKENYRP